MLDIRALRQYTEVYKSRLASKNFNIEIIDRLLDKDQIWREKTVHLNEQKSQLNSSSKKIGQIKKEGGNAGSLMQEMKNLSSEIK